jgi:hypothetical protein
MNDGVAVPSEPCKRELRYFFTAVVDVLGQQERLRALKALPDESDASAMQATLKQLRTTVGVVTGVRKGIDQFFRAYLAESPEAASWPEPLRSQVQQARSCDILQHGLSDAVVISVSLRSGVVPLKRINGALAAMLATASIVVLTMSSGNRLG